MTTTNNNAIFTCTLSPRYTDLDTERHVNNSRMYQLHLEARMHAHIQCFGKDAWFSDDIRLRPLRTQTHYHQISWYGSDIEAQVRITECTEDSFQLHSQLYQHDQLVGSQHSIIAAYQRGQRVPLPTSTQQIISGLVTGKPELLPVTDYHEALAHAHNFPVRQRLTPRYSDLDPDSLRSEAALGIYMEQARVGGIQQLDLDGLGVLVAAVDISFTHFQPGWAPVELASGISRIGKSSFLFTGCALHKGEIQVAANSVMVVADPETNRPISIPPALREQLEGWLVV